MFLLLSFKLFIISRERKKKKEREEREKKIIILLLSVFFINRLHYFNKDISRNTHIHEILIL